MTATNDDLLIELKKITNLLQGLYGGQEQAEIIKNSSNVKIDTKEVFELVKE